MPNTQQQIEDITLGELENYVAKSKNDEKLFNILGIYVKDNGYYGLEAFNRHYSLIPKPETITRAEAEKRLGVKIED